jgi:hypothetical protein
MARRSKEEVLTVMINRQVHANLRKMQTLFNLRTLSDAVDLALTVVDRTPYKAVVEASTNGKE